MIRATEKKKHVEWLLSSTVDAHVSMNEADFKTYESLERPRMLDIGYGRTVEAIGVGDIVMRTTGNKK